jgi:hypothetical protein
VAIIHDVQGYAKEPEDAVADVLKAGMSFFMTLASCQRCMSYDPLQFLKDEPFHCIVHIMPVAVTYQDWNTLGS